MTSRACRTVAAAALIALGVTSAASAQQAAPRPGWSFEVAPYIWLPTVSGTLRHQLPQGLGGSADVKADAGDYFEQLNAALLLSAAARYDRFTLLTDIMYVSADAGSSRVQAVDIANVGRNPISSSVNASGEANLKMTLWTLAGATPWRPAPGAMSMRWPACATWVSRRRPTTI